MVIEVAVAMWCVQLVLFAVLRRWPVLNVHSAIETECCRTHQ
jgi:hypothetical protein